MISEFDQKNSSTRGLTGFKLVPFDNDGAHLYSWEMSVGEPFCVRAS